MKLEALIDEMIDDFYFNFGSQTWGKIDEFYRQVQLTFEDLGAITEDNEKYQYLNKELGQLIADFSTSLENGDRTLCIDWLEYGFKSFFRVLDDTVARRN